MKNLENYGVKSLLFKDLRSTNGGWMIALALLVVEAIADGEGSKSSFQAGFESA